MQAGPASPAQKAAYSVGGMCEHADQALETLRCGVAASGSRPAPDPYCAEEAQVSATPLQQARQARPSECARVPDLRQTLRAVGQTHTVAPGDAMRSSNRSCLSLFCILQVLGSKPNLQGPTWASHVLDGTWQPAHVGSRDQGLKLTQQAACDGP